MRKRIFFVVVLVVHLLGLLVIWYLSPIYAIVNESEQPISLYIDANDTQDSVRVKVGSPKRWDFVDRVLDAKPRTGHYLILPKEKMIDLYRKLRNGMQTTVKVVVPECRTVEMLAGHLSRRLMLDSMQLVTLFHDSVYCDSLGYTVQTLPALFVPNTYDMWWDVSAERFMKRMWVENDNFWNADRRAKADSIGLSKVEVVTLASIVAEETAYTPEMPTVAGMYINRLRIGMPLQADPTVKFALGDFTLRRIYYAHLEVESPYNTYKYAGLPPGPICIPSIKAIDAVLNHEQHGYLYMCAKEDFSGSHNFAKTYGQHLANARRYSRALNARGLK